MTGLDLLLAVAGVGVTVLVVIGMFLITPKGVERAPRHLPDPVEPRAAADVDADRPVPA